MKNQNFEIKVFKSTKDYLKIGNMLYDKNRNALRIYGVKNKKNYKQITTLRTAADGCNNVEYYDSFQIGRELFLTPGDCSLQKTILRKDPRYAEFFDAWDKCSKKITFSKVAVPRSEQYEQKHYLKVITKLNKVKQQILEQSGGSVTRAEFFAKRGQNSYFQDIERIDRQISDPFFARIDYKEEKGVYIGKNEISKEVIDWTDERAALYYEYQIYVADKSSGLSLVRSFNIEKSGLKSFSDLFISDSNDNDLSSKKNSRNVIADPHLMKILESGRRTKRVHDIIQSIQTNQYRIITSDFREPFILIGCAGSGKTMILYHRLRYMVRNDTSIKPDSVIILSPTGTLNAESDILTKTLQLERVNKYSTISFYESLIRRFSKEKKIYHNLDDIAATSDRADELSNEVVKTVYSTTFQETVSHKVGRILNRGTEENALFIQDTEAELDSMLQIYFSQKDPNILQLISRDNSIKRLMKAYKNARTALLTASKKSIDLERARLKNSIIEQLQIISRQEKECKEKYKINEAIICEKLAQLKKAEEELKKLNLENVNVDKNTVGYLSSLLTMKRTQNRVMSEDELKKKRDKVTQLRNSIDRLKREIDGAKKQSTQEKKILQQFNNNLKYLSFLENAGCLRGADDCVDYDSIFRFIDLLEKYKVQGKYSLNYEIDNNLVDTFDFIDSIIREIAMFLKFRDGDKQDFYFDRVFEYVMHCQKEKLLLDQEYRYHFELFTKLYALHFTLGVADCSERFINVDEFQDFSALELDLLKAVFPSSVFNYYGDYQQCINPKGISAEDMLPKCLQGIAKYKVSENYRNAQNITEHINREFSMKMMAIGIKGEVSHSKKVPFSESDIRDNDRIAIIYNDSTDLEKYNISSDNTVYYFLPDDESLLRSDKINVLPIQRAKGLEFEKVAVIQSKMTENELYVAMSRALNSLILLD